MSAGKARGGARWTYSANNGRPTKRRLRVSDREAGAHGYGKIHALLRQKLSATQADASRRRIPTSEALSDACRRFPKAGSCVRSSQRCRQTLPEGGLLLQKLMASVNPAAGCTPFAV